MPYHVEVTQRADQDTNHILQITFLRWGGDAKRRYTNLLKRAYRQLESNPYGVGTKSVENSPPNLRRLPLRNINQNKGLNRVKNPPHVIFYRIREPNLVVVLRILHDHMDVATQLNDQANP
ncbi:MAG: type II toxin-antitoxin system RelE/ParE family toxin [Candidatus Symbiobacter sp.]|nr:type II toxin-antitoxin system RelE/ParE family toxin [Candidatus Symbiobacter sp.]